MAGEIVVPNLEPEKVIHSQDTPAFFQVVSASKQFNAWSERKGGKIRTLASLRARGQKNSPNIPWDIQFSFYEPTGWNSMQDLYYVLCPPKDLSSPDNKTWQHAVEVAKEVVLDTDAFKAKYKWNPPQEVYLYAHAPTIQKMQQIEGIQLMSCIQKQQKDKTPSCVPTKLIGGPGTCPQFRLFEPVPVQAPGL